MAEYPELHDSDGDKLTLWGSRCADIKCWPHESIYTVLSRFAQVTGVPGNAIERGFKSTRRRITQRSGIAGLETLAVLNLSAAVKRLGVSWKVIESMFLRVAPFDQCDVCSPYLRFCTICMGARRHFVFFQREQMHRCPFHHTVLLNRCPACGHHAEYTWGAGLFLLPFCCPACKVPLAGAQMRQSFFDLLTPHREALFQRYGRIPTSTEGSHAANLGCPGFLLTHPKMACLDSFNQGQPPLLERRVSEVNWSLENGFVQARTLLGHNGKLQEASEVGIRELIQCLKSILRHVRKAWRLRLLTWCPSRASEEKRGVYQLFCESWGISQDSIRPERAAARLETAVGTWLACHNDAGDTRHWPRSARAWFTTHSFSSHVLDSLSRCAETSAWSSDVDRGFILAYVAGTHRPIWPLELIHEHDRRSYRLLRQQRFLSQLLY